MGGVEGLSDEQMMDIKDGFERWQEEGTQYILTSNLGAVVRYLGQNPTDIELNDMKNEVDKDGTGTVEFGKFASMLVNALKHMDTEEELIEGFKVFDLDGNGFISAAEFQHVTMGLGETCTDEEIAEMVRDADLDADGQINYEEFVAMLQAKVDH